MKFVPLIWSGIWRKPVRTALIFLQVCVAFALFGVLQGMKSGMDRAIAATRADVLYVGPAVFGETLLSIGQLNRLQSVPGEPETFSVKPKDLEALRKTRTGLLITADIAKEYGWHIGQDSPDLKHPAAQRLRSLDVRYRGNGHVSRS